MGKGDPKDSEHRSRMTRRQVLTGMMAGGAALAVSSTATTGSQAKARKGGRHYSMSIYAHHWGRTGDALQRCLDDAPGGSDIVLSGEFVDITPTVIRLPQHRSSRIRGEANACPRYVDSSGGALVRAADSASGPLLSVIGDEGPEVRAELSIERIKLDGWQSNCDTLLLIDNVKDILLDRLFVQRSKGHGVWVKRNHQVLARYVECHQCQDIGFWGQLGGDNLANWIKAAGCGLGIKLGAGWTVPGELRAYLNEEGIRLNGPRTVVTVAHANDNETMGIVVTSTKVALLTVIVKNNPIQVMSDTYVGHTLDMT